MRASLLLLSILLLGCHAYRVCENRKKHTVVGIARNSGNRAIIETENYIYDVPDVAFWSEKFLNKEVKVTGKLKMIKNEDTLLSDTASHHDHEFQLILFDAKWRLNSKKIN